MKRLLGLIAPALLAGWFGTASAQTAGNRASLETQNNTFVYTNGMGAVTAATLNPLLGNYAASMATLLDANVFLATQTYLAAPIFAGLTGYCYANGNSPISCSTSINGASIVGTNTLALSLIQQIPQRSVLGNQFGAQGNVGAPWTVPNSTDTIIPLVHGAVASGDYACFSDSLGTLKDCGPIADNFAATAPISVSFPSGIPTFALNYDPAYFTLSGNNLTLAASGVTAGTYGDGTHSTQVTFDAKGRATSASSVAITPASSSVSYSQGGISALTRSLQNWQQDRISIMDFCTPAQVASDITACGQAAINAAAAQATVSYGGKQVFLPAQYSPYMLLGTLDLPGFVGLVGEGPQTSYIECANGSSDCVQVGQASGAQTRYQSIRDLGIIGSAKTAGAGIHIYNAYNVLLQDLDLDQMTRGVDVETNTNTITLRDDTINVDEAASDYGIYWHAPGDGSSRSDQLSLDHVSITGGYAGTTTGIGWDGLANTLSMNHVYLGKLTYGMRVTNSAASASYYPAFANIWDLECEGAQKRCVDIEAGRYFKFSGSDITNASGTSGQGSLDDYAFYVGADSAASITTGVQISNSRIGNSREQGLYSAGRNVQGSNLSFFSTSLAGSGSYPAMELAASTVGAHFGNVTCEEYGGAADASYCLTVDSGAADITVKGLDAKYMLSGPINDLGATGSTYAGIVDQNGVSWTGYGASTMQTLNVGDGSTAASNGGTLTAANTINGGVGIVAHNKGTASTGSGVYAFLEIATGTANSNVNWFLKDNSGSPFLLMSGGAGLVGNWQMRMPGFQFETVGGTNLVTLNSSALAAAVPVAPPTYTIAGLPTCGTAQKGYLAYVVDTVAASAPAWHGSVAGGGSTAVSSLVSCTGSAWQYE